MKKTKIAIAIMLFMFICVAIELTLAFKKIPINIEFKSIGNWENVSFAQQTESGILLSLEKNVFPLFPYAESLYLFDKEDYNLIKIKNGNHINVQCSKETIYYQESIHGQVLSGIYGYNLQSGKVKHFLRGVYVESFFVQENKIIFTTERELRIVDSETANEITISKNVEYFYLPEKDTLWFQSGSKLLSYDIGTNEYETLFDINGSFLQTIQNTNEILCFLRELEGRYDFCIFDKKDLSTQIFFSTNELIIDVRMTEDNSIVFWNGEQLNKLDSFQKISTIAVFNAEQTVALLKDCFCVKNLQKLNIDCYDYKGNLLYTICE